jgi:hypothetical protein
VPAGEAGSRVKSAPSRPVSGEPDLLLRVDELDLEPIVYKLTHPDPGDMPLSLPRADEAIAMYRCFLKLCVLYPDVALVPTRLIDQVWHAHMLDTAKYSADCDRVFGGIMHHFPYAGLRGESDRRAWGHGFDRTRRLFLEHFGSDIGGQPAASACRNHGDGSDCCIGYISPESSDVRPRPLRDAREV